MKKLVMLIAAIMLMGGVTGSLHAGDGRATPTATGSGAIPADYGGVDYWGSAFTANTSTIALPTGGLATGTFGNIASTSVPNTADWVIYGAYFSTGTTSDFIDLFVSTGGFVAASSTTTLRFYNVAQSSGGPGAFSAGVTPLRWPIHRVGNLFMRPSSNGYNNQGILYYKDPDK